MKYLYITSPDVNNGLGCRVTLWVSGCSHHCKGCHNPETWEYNQGQQLISDHKASAFNKVSKELDKPYIQGLTISGGDPLSQSDDDLKELLNFIKQIKRKYPEKDIWIYAGDTLEDILKNSLKLDILEYCDVLVEGPFIISQRDIRLPFRGSKNQRIIDIQKTLDTDKITLLQIE